MSQQRPREHKEQETEILDPRVAELLAGLEDYSPPGIMGTPDALQGYYIHFERALPEYDGLTSRAYAVSQGSQEAGSVYAVICDPHLPLRHKLIEYFKNTPHPSVCRIYAYGMVYISALEERRFALIMERPKGSSLSSLLLEQKRIPERVIIDNIISPLVNVIETLGEQGYSVGNLNIDTLYMTDRVMVTDCFSEPAGYAQSFLFEPPERLGISLLGKADGDSGIDLYALGVTTVMLSLGVNHLRQITFHDFSYALIQHGVYNFITAGREYSETIQDFFRGTLTESSKERWGIPQARAWLMGKRFNMLRPSHMKDSARSYSFANREYSNIRGLANAYFLNWEEAKTDLRGVKLTRWMEMSAHRKDVAERINRIKSQTGGDTSRNERMNNEFIARSLIIMDPQGPIRYRHMACDLTGVAGLLAHAIHSKSQEDMQAALDIIDIDLHNAWADAHKSEELAPAISALFTRLQRVRLMMRQNILGQGRERALYDMNPTLPCLSDLVVKACPNSVEELLKALDALALTHAKENMPMDRHIAAFLCSKMDISRDTRINNMSFRPALMNHPDLIALDLLRRAQERYNVPDLVGLSTWLAIRCLNVVDKYYNLPLRKNMKDALVKNVASGQLSHVCSVVMDQDLAQKDMQGFRQAAYDYIRHTQHIQDLNNPFKIKIRAKEVGVKVAVVIAYIVLGLVLLQTMR